MTTAQPMTKMAAAMADNLKTDAPRADEPDAAGQGRPAGQQLGAVDDMCSVPLEAIAVDAAGNAEPLVWQLPEEVAVAVQINTEPYTVMMATPANLTDFGIGFVLAEGIVERRSDILGVLVMPVENGFAVDIAIDEEALAEARMPRRSIEGRSGCGLCGVENIADVVRVTKPVPHTVRPSAAAILKAARELPRRQTMNRFNRTVHGAAWVTLDGEIMLVREDVGRHNALDKLIGAMADANIELTSGFVLMTSRCSFELVQKSATYGIGALVTVSAPTALALEIARKANLFVASPAGERVVILNS
ncbi:formate dehydrogenase accessory sulfurtransferase FdhD [Hyphomicrobium sulfonivorans]|uniref:formate dehydrogenase accessory sulfurtransferase FdhD n=1 Tax=Hyphomicrobium sulfonivorans TaxID=121290 RepID=UPI001FE5A536|nr:formate dehydrogenase accessory sulfurtransferase FdhD [Hyphomicrobium sulfonivorans]